MLGFTPLAVTPLAVANANNSYLGEITDGATANNTSLVAVANFVTGYSDSVTGVDVVDALGSVFNVAMSETSTGTDSTSSVPVFECVIDEVATSSDSTSVAASTFNAPIEEAVNVVDAFLAAAVFIATVQGSAVAADQVVARYLWELIDDSQSAGWASINDAQTPGWTTINDAQSTAWTVIGTDNV